MGNWFGGGKNEPMNKDPQLDAKCQAAVSAAAKELVGTGVKLAEVHKRGQENAAEAGVSCSITPRHVTQAVDAAKGR